MLSNKILEKLGFLDDGGRYVLVEYSNFGCRIGYWQNERHYYLNVIYAGKEVLKWELTGTEQDLQDILPVAKEVFQSCLMTEEGMIGYGYGQALMVSVVEMERAGFIQISPKLFGKQSAKNKPIYAYLYQDTDTRNMTTFLSSATFGRATEANTFEYNVLDYHAALKSIDKLTFDEIAKNLGFIRNTRPGAIMINSYVYDPQDGFASQWRIHLYYNQSINEACFTPRHKYERRNAGSQFTRSMDSIEETFKLLLDKLNKEQLG